MGNGRPRDDGTGDFALHPHTIFQTDAPTFTYLGKEDFRERRALRYEYRVSQLVSGYRITIGNKEAVVGYHGSFWADAETLELLALDVEAEEIPPELGLSQAVTQIGYGKVRIGNSDFLLLQSAELTLEYKSGAASRNQTQFTHCRQYTAESVLSFEQPVKPGPTPGKPVTEIELPAGLVLVLRLETAIDSQKTVVGDAIAAKLLKNVKQGGKLIVPAGAQINGRIRRLEKRAFPGLEEHYLVGLEFSEIEFGNTRARFFAQMEEVGPGPRVTRGVPVPERRSALPAPRPGAWNVPETSSPARGVVGTAELPGVGTFYVRGTRFQLSRVDMVWRTTELR